MLNYCLTKEDYVDLLNMHVQDMIIELNEKYDMQWYRFERPNLNPTFKYRKSSRGKACSCA